MPLDWCLVRFRALGGPYPLMLSVPYVALAVRVISRRQEVDGLAQYRVIVGLDYPPDRRVEAGDVVNDIPGKSVRWLLDQGLIEEVSGGKPGKTAPAAPVTDDGDDN